MLPSSNNRITRYGLIVFFLVVAGYGAFEARGLVIGPTITLNTLPSETTVQFIKINGNADRIASLSMNGTPIAVTESGEFSEPFLLAPGTNDIFLEAQDRVWQPDDEKTANRLRSAQKQHGGNEHIITVMMSISPRIFPGMSYT